ncbi:hypothetical protein CCO03_01465 [Comamonas serinivorans]|uniref:Major facilitator superfamily (MFS) profile domain-containing protein n=1 Tax=Comamonas serinivorans TaxID=1082851 RepID=A0A1Y0EJC3_9BURK|nr:MFS transporter [Comamonas serinivorans]ARU03528.1 hypothetical protein CCO03_01465 [Comamonas serinivorans]
MTAADRERRRIVITLGIAQTFAWGSTYYLPAILATPMAADLGVTASFVFAAFSMSLLVTAVLGPWFGRAIDQRGGRPFMAATSVIFAVSLLMLALAQGRWTLILAWVGIGIGSAMGLYEAAFATVVRLYGASARGAITGITLIGGFTGTVSWPLSTFLEAHLGWRWACVVWAAINLLVCLPLYLSLPPERQEAPALTSPAGQPGGIGATPSTTPSATLSPATTASPLAVPTAAPQAAPHAPGTVTTAPAGAPANGMGVRLNDPRVLLLAFLFAALGIVATAMASQLPGVLMASGVSAGTALWVSMLVGPTQVAARIVELRFMGNRSPMLSTWLATGLHPVGALCLLLLGPPAALVFGLVHGVGNGLLTIARGALPLAIFGPKGYGQLQGWLLAPARITQAFTPWWFGLALASWGGQALWLTAGLSVLGLLALAGLQRVMTRQTAAATLASPQIEAR